MRNSMFHNNSNNDITYTLCKVIECFEAIKQSAYEIFACTHNDSDNLVIIGFVYYYYYIIIIVIKVHCRTVVQNSTK